MPKPSERDRLDAIAGCISVLGTLENKRDHEAWNVAFTLLSALCWVDDVAIGTRTQEGGFTIDQEKTAVIYSMMQACVTRGRLLRERAEQDDRLGRCCEVCGELPPCDCDEPTITRPNLEEEA